jgi:hypothetical protein
MDLSHYLPPLSPFLISHSVATGLHLAKELAGLRPDFLLDDLSNTELVLNALS